MKKETRKGMKKEMKKGKEKKGGVVIVKADDTPRNTRFESLVLKTQSQLKDYLKSYFTKKGNAVVEDTGWLYVEGTLPVLLTAHLDTVHKELPKKIVYKDGTVSSPQGIGGDDRCGVYAILEIVKELNCHVLFCEDEEIGGAGSDLFAATDLCANLGKKVNYVIEIDRKGADDAVYYDQANREFEKFVETEFWRMNYGTFTDICNICPVLDVSGVNLSCGYYKQHTTNEYVVLKELETAIQETKKLIRRTDPTVTFPYVEEVKRWTNKYYGSWYDFPERVTEEYFYITYWYGSKQQTEFVPGVNLEAAVGSFLIDNPDMCYGDIVEVGYEDEYPWDELKTAK